MIAITLVDAFPWSLVLQQRVGMARRGEGEESQMQVPNNRAEAIQEFRKAEADAARKMMELERAISAAGTDADEQRKALEAVRKAHELLVFARRLGLTGERFIDLMIARGRNPAARQTQAIRLPPSHN